MSECAVGHATISGLAWKVKLHGHDSEMCEFHGRIYQHGRKMLERFGADDPAVVELLELSDRQMDSACPRREGYPLSEPGAEGQNSPLLRRGLATRCAGVPGGTVVG